MAEIEWPTVAELADQVRRKERAAVEVVDQALAAIEAGNDALNAFVVVDADLARRAAADVDATVARGEDPGPLAGVPFGVKDLEDCAGLPTSHGSLLFKDGPPAEEDSVQVGPHAGRRRGAARQDRRSRVRHAQLHEDEGVGRHPQPVGPGPHARWLERRFRGRGRRPASCRSRPRATAAGRPASPPAFTGLVGLKAGYGRIPNIGASGSQTAVNGVLTTTVADAARHLDVVAGPDLRVRTSLPAPASPTSGPSRSWTRRASGPAGRSTSASPPSTRRSAS